MFLLDTDCLGIFQRGSQLEARALGKRMEDYEPSDFYVTIVSFQEQVSGWNAYLNRAKTTESVVRAYRKLLDLLRDFGHHQVLPFDELAATQFWSFRGQNVRIGTLDLRIAAVAISRNLTLISRNLVDFERVPGLHVEDWTKPR